METKGVENLKDRLLNSKFRKICFESFVRQVDLKNSSHEEVFNWFNNYLQNSAYGFEIIILHISNQLIKKQSKEEIDEEYKKDVNDVIKFLIELQKYINEPQENEKV